MILIHVSVQIKEGMGSDFERTLVEVVAEARKTGGCIKYGWYRVPDFSQAYIIYGEFDAQENFEKYLNSAVVKRIEGELMPLLAIPPGFKHYNATILESG